jgi:hypothetical protein
MNSLKFHRLAALLAATMLVAGCSGIQPYNPPDDKETPPGSGLLTGPDGEFVIYRKNAEADTDSDRDRHSKQ